MRESLKSLFASHPQRAALLIAILVVALVAGVYAYLSSPQPRAGPKASVTSPPLEISISLDEAEYEPWPIDNVTITFTVKNISNQTVILHRNSFFGYMDIPVYLGDWSITDSNGTELYRYSIIHGSIQSVINFGIKPGEEINQAYVWYQEYYDSSWRNLHASPGTYFIKGILNGYGINGGPAVTIETPQISFVIK